MCMLQYAQTPAFRLGLPLRSSLPLTLFSPSGRPLPLLHSCSQLIQLRTIKAHTGRS